MSEANAHSANEQTAGVEANAPAPESTIETTNNPSTENQGLGGSGEEVTPSQGTEATTPTMDERISNITDPDQFDALMAEMQQNPQMMLTKQAPAKEAAPAPPEGTEHPAKGEEAPAPTKGNQDDADESEGEEDGAEKLPQFRLRPKEKVDAEALRIMKAAEAANSPISLKDALLIAERRLGIAPTEPSKAELEKSQDVDDEGDADGDDPTEGITLAEAKQNIKDLRKQQAQALRDGDLDEAADIAEQLSDAEDLVEVIAEREKSRESQKLATHNATFGESVAKATDLYPDFGNENSEFYIRCKEIDETLRDTEDPRYYDANKPLMVAQMAAREMNIAPMSASRKAQIAQPAAKAQPVPSQAPQQTTTSPQPPRTERPGQLPAASGASRTSGVPTGAAASLAEQVANIKSPEDFERLALQAHAAGAR